MTLEIALRGSGSGSGGGGGATATSDALLTTAYYHVSDSDGGTPAADTDAIIAFEPSGVAQLALANETDFLSYRGTYEESAAGTHIAFPDIQVDFTAALDPGAGTVTLPFKLFSEGTGTSTWARHEVNVAHGLNLVIRAAVMSEHQSPEDALARVEAYANAVVARDAQSLRASSVTSALGLAGSARSARLFGWPPAPKLTRVESDGAGTIRLTYDGGPPVSVQLFGWAQATVTPLRMSPLASDPRVHLDVQAPGDGTADPISRTALFVAPFKSLRSFAWWDAPWAQRICSSCIAQTQGFLFRGSDYFDFDGVEGKLEAVGYSVTQLADDAATPVAIVQALLSGATPGFVVINTHGEPNGNLATGTMIGWSEGGVDHGNGNAATALKALRDAGYGDLLTYAGGTEDNPNTIAVMSIPNDMRPGRSSAFISFTPRFWEWLRSRGANFGRSLVYVASCHTDASPTLREAVRARAYFAFNQIARPQVAGAIFNYFGQSLLRATHSAEDVYYNIIRVANTRQMIYAEDKLFDGIVDGDASEQHRVLMNEFKGYGLESAGAGAVVAYQDAGWLGTPGADPGAIWWMLFAGRWDGTAAGGAQALMNCWWKYWNNKELGGVADTFCNTANPGRLPTEAELRYAYYLLVGVPGPGLAASPQLVPRFTLHDGDRP